jgi:hypothetical protein
MKSLLQVGLTLAVIVGGVFVITFGTQFTRTPVAPAPVAAKGEATLTGLPLKVPERKAVWDSSDEDYAAELEVGTKGHYDFWVSNVHPKPVRATAEYKSCVCADVQIALVPPEARLSLAKTVAPLEAAFGLLGVPSLAAPIATPKMLAAIGKFESMGVATPASQPTVVTIPAADPVAGPQLAIVRLNFNRKESKPLRVVANLRAFVEGLPPETTEFEASTVIVPPVIVSPVLINFGSLGPNDVREKAIIAWSPTREQFQVEAEEVFHDPCIEVRPPRPMTAEERATLPYVMRAEGISGNTRIKSGYVIKVGLHERRDGKQLELGPLNRKVAVRSPEQPEVTVLLGGTVRGGVRVGEGTDQDRVNLATFRADRDVAKTVIVTSTEPGLDLELKGKTPDFLNVSFVPYEGAPGVRQWQLRVEIEPNKHSGFLPGESAVYLQTKTTPPRSIRIPVVGNATR